MEPFLGYDDGPWDIRLAATYRDNYLDEVGSKPLMIVIQMIICN